MRNAMLGVLVTAAIAAAVALARPPIFEVAQMAPAVGPAYVDSFTVSCATSPTLITSGNYAQISYSCQAPAAAETGGTVLVAVGDSAIGDPAFATRNSPVYSGDTIREWGGNTKKEYCRADTGTVTIFCRALVATAGAP